MSNLKIQCDVCKGSGNVPHQRRMLNDHPDPMDFQTIELCPKCGGSGKMSAPLPAEG